MSHQIHFLQIECRADAFNIFHKMLEGNLRGIDISGRPAAQSLVEKDQLEVPGQLAHVRQQIGVVQSGAAMQHDDGFALTEDLVVKLGAVDLLPSRSGGNLGLFLTLAQEKNTQDGNHQSEDTTVGKLCSHSLLRKSNLSKIERNEGNCQVISGFD